jgi:hypothetical protein
MWFTKTSRLLKSASALLASNILISLKIVFEVTLVPLQASEIDIPPPQQNSIPCFKDYCCS